MVFSTGKVRRKWVSPTSSQKFAQLTPEKISHKRFIFPPTKCQFSCNYPVQRLFLVVVIAAVSLFNFMSYVHIYQANFDFNLCSIFVKCFFRIKKGLNVQNYTSLDSLYLIKKSPKNFSYLVQIPQGSQLGLGTQPGYKAPGDLQVKG